ncbi:MAG: hypothetical protein SF187_23000 [Deltaproteobacteria bacterium]|nr:hypothetical protein [Deltaproteobacteria bacterium]
MRTPATELRPFLIEPTAPLENAWYRVRSCVDAQRRITIADDPFSHRACTVVATAQPDGAGNFTAPPLRSALGSETDAFAEVSAYHHVGRALAYFHARLPAAQPVLRSPIDVIVSARIAGTLIGSSVDDLVPFGGARYVSRALVEGESFRAYYDSQRSLIWLGVGPNTNWAYDGDAVMHETVHAVFDQEQRLGGYALSPEGLSADPQALSEALADYFTAAIAGDANIAEFALGGTVNGRDLALSNTHYPQLTKDVYAESLAFSGALWRVRSQLQPVVDSFDVAVMDTARAMLTASVSGDVFMQALDALLRERGLAEAAHLLRREMSERGVWPRKPRVLPLAEGAEVRSATGFVAPGRKHVPQSNVVPGLFTAVVDLPADALQMRLDVRVTTFQRVFWGNERGTDAQLVALVSWDDSDFVALPNKELAVSVVRHALDGPVIVTVPLHATRAFVQIGNAGDEDGAFEGLTVSFPSMDELRKAEGGCSFAGGRPRKVGLAVVVLGGLAIVALVLKRRRAAAVVTSPPHDTLGAPPAKPTPVPHSDHVAFGRVQ